MRTSKEVTQAGRCMILIHGVKMETAAGLPETKETEYTGMNEMKTLDRSRPYGEIFGSPSGAASARYEQDGMLFDARGNIVSAQGISGKPIESPVEEQGAESYFPKEEQELVVEQEENCVNHENDVIKPDEEPLAPVLESTPSPEEIAFKMASEGKTNKEIRTKTGLHYKTIKKIVADASRLSKSSMA
jgi:hypothetical protein